MNSKQCHIRNIDSESTARRRSKRTEHPENELSGDKHARRWPMRGVRTERANLPCKRTESVKGRRPNPEKQGKRKQKHEKQGKSRQRRREAREKPTAAQETEERAEARRKDRPNWARKARGPQRGQATSQGPGAYTKAGRESVTIL